MDRMVINSEMGTTLISKAVSKIISKKLGQDVVVKLKDLDLGMNEEGHITVQSEVYASFKLTESLLKGVL